MLGEPMMPTDNPGGGKSFWSKPEGRASIITNVIIGVVIFYFWGTIAPFVAQTFDDTLHIVVMAILLAAIAYVAIMPDFRRYLWFVYRAIMRGLAQALVNRDPIGIRKTILEKYKAKKEDLEDIIGQVRGLRAKLERSLAEKKAAYDESMSKLKVAAKLEADPDPERQRRAARIKNLESTEADRLSKRITQYTKHSEKYDYTIVVLTRYLEMCSDKIIETDRVIKDQEEDRAMSSMFQRGMKSAKAVLRGNAEDLEMDEMATAKLEEDYANAMGEVENFLNLTKDEILKADFNDAAATERVAHKLENWTEPKESTAPASPVSKDSSYF